MYMYMQRGVGDLQVVPRQTCQLYTHTYSNDTFKGGWKELVNVAEGGTVFSTLLYNPVSLSTEAFVPLKEFMKGFQFDLVKGM